MFNIEKDYLTPNPYSRPQIPMDYVQTIDVHWSAAMNATAKNLRDGFEKQVELKNNKASYHYSVDWDGAIQWMPTAEAAWSIGAYHYFPWILEKWGARPDLHSVGVLLCHRDNVYGVYDRPTLYNAVELLAFLCQFHGLHPQTRILMHSQFTGKGLMGKVPPPGQKPALPCPRYFISNPPAWQAFIQEIESRTEELEMERRDRES